MQLLLLTASRLDETSHPLPSLELLAHEVHVVPLSSALTAVAAHEANARSTIDAILIDGTESPLSARSAAHALNDRVAAPRIVILADTALAALSADWGVAELLLPDVSPAELDARLRLLQGRSAQATPNTQSGSPAVQVGIEIDESNFIARVHGRTLDLTYKEFELLHFLALHPARVFTRERLLAEVWGSDYFGGTRTVDVHVRRLRSKLGDHESLISTVRGVGYGFARGWKEEEER